MSSVAARKCVQHPAREAVACCPSCGKNFCRECVVEHAGLLLCASCLAKESSGAAKPAGERMQRLRQWATTAVCVMLLWTVFYFAGSILKLIPADVHEGTIWQVP